MNVFKPRNENAGTSRLRIKCYREGDRDAREGREPATEFVRAIHGEDAASAYDAGYETTNRMIARNAAAWMTV